MDLDRLFDRRQDSLIKVEDVFVDRADHIDAFDATIENMQDRKFSAATAPPQRQNVLVYYGLGGIGKSTLSRHLEDRFLAQPKSDDLKRIICRLNLDDPSLLEFETALLLIRCAVGEGLRSCPAFDLAFSAYWEQRHPGLSLKDFLDRNSALHRFNRSFDISKQLDDTLNALLGGIPLGGLARKTTTTLGTRLRDKVRRDRLLDGCLGFRQILEAESPSDMLPFLPALLSWDITEARRKRICLVVFIDTFERVDELRREPGGVEDSFARMMYLLPNVLFVISGRNRLTWGDKRQPAIHYSGPNYWPALASPPRHPFSSMQQQLLGLGDEYSRSFVELRLTCDGEPAIPPDIREVIVGASGGVPLYLELSAEYFDQLATGSRSPRAEWFGGTFPEMVTRVMRDLTPTERALLRAASLLDRFDPQLLRAAVPEVRDAAVNRFIARPLIKPEDNGWLRHSLDDYIRLAVRRHDHETDDPWSAGEWASAASQMLTSLEERLRGDRQEPSTADRARLTQGFKTAGLLTVSVRAVPDWLYDTAYALRLQQLTTALSSSENWAAEAGEPTEAFSLACRGVAQRTLGNRQRSVELLERAAAHPAVTPYGRLFANHRLAKALEEVGRYRDAETLVAQVASQPSALQEIAQKDLAWIRWIRGNGKALLKWSLPNRSSAVGYRRAQALDLLGQLYLTQGQFEAAEACYRELIDDPELEAGQILRDTGWRHLGMVLAWSRPVEAGPVLDRALEINQAASVMVGVAQIAISRAVSQVGRAPFADILRLLDQGAALLRPTDGEADTWMVLLARLFLAAVEGTAEELRAAAQALSGHVDDTDCHPGLAEIAARWLEVRHVESDTNNLDSCEYWIDRQQALDSWERILRERQESRLAQRTAG